jgi:solute:Na+ symporter, SSS family
MIIVGLTLYVIMIMLIGVKSGNKINSVDDYFVAGRKFSYYLAIPTIVANWFGAGSCMGVASIVYSHGFSGSISDPLGCALALFVAAFFYVGKLRKKNYVTIADLIRDTYGVKAEVFSSFLMIPFNLGVLAAQLVALGYIFSLFLGFSSLTGVVLGGLTVLVYTSIGGMWTVTVTDFIQFLIVVGGLLFLLPVTLNEVPDLGAFWELFKTEGITLLPHNQVDQGWLMYMGKWFLTGLGAIMGQDLLQRIFSCKSERVAVVSTFTSGGIYLCLGMLPLSLGLVGRILLPELDQPELLIPALAKTYLSPFLVNLFAIGLLLAIMSTADSYLLAGTAIIANNVVSRYLGSSKRALVYIRLINLGCVTAALFLGLSMSRIFDLMVHSGALLLVAIFVPVTTALYFPKAAAEAAWTSMFTGLAAWLCYIACHFQELLANHGQVLYPAVIVGALASLAGYALPYVYWALTRPLGLKWTPKTGQIS